MPFLGPWVFPIAFPVEPCVGWLGSQRAQCTSRALRPSDPAQPGPQAGAPAALADGLGGHYAFARRCSSTATGSTEMNPGRLRLFWKLRKNNCWGRGRKPSQSTSRAGAHTCPHEPCHGAWPMSTRMKGPACSLGR